MLYLLLIYRKKHDYLCNSPQLNWVRAFMNTATAARVYSHK